MRYVLRAQDQLCRTINRKNERRRHNVVARVRVSVIKTDEIVFVLFNERRVCATRLPITAWIEHIPSELLRDDIDLKSICGRLAEMKLRPDALPHHGKTYEDYSRDDGPQNL